MHIKIISATIITLFLLSARAAAELPSGPSGNLVYPGCVALKGLQNPIPKIEIEHQFNAGICMGTILAIVQLSTAFENKYQFCMPAAATVQQAMTVVTRYLEQNPRDLHLLFSALVVIALKEAWPC